MAKKKQSSTSTPPPKEKAVWVNGVCHLFGLPKPKPNPKEVKSNG